MSIKENLEEIRESIDRNARIAGRKGEDITLVAVTKTVDVKRIAQAVELGCTTLGENKVQEFLSKCDILGKNVDWHIIGQLQKNKVKYIIDKIGLLHSLSSLSVAQEIQRLCERKDTTLDCLVQVNVSREESKSGVYQEDLEAFLEALDSLNRVRIRGLMTMAPFSPDPEEARPVFHKLKEWFDKLSGQESDRMQMRYLSMGMSGDFQVAIQEGANMVRIGSSIFGERF